MAAAAAGGAQAVLLTDHDSREAARQGYEGWHGNVLLLVGHEVTTRRGHLLVFGVEREIEHQGKTETEICAEVSAQGGFAFAAHPFSRGGFSRAIVVPHPWSALEQCEECGIELWSLVTDEAESWRTPFAALRFLSDPEGSIRGPAPDHLARWDRLTAQRRTPAIGGLDAHQTGVRIRGRVLSPMPHDRYFRLLRTHVLVAQPPTHDLASDRAAIYAALREGRCYLGLDAVAPARGFAFTAQSDELGIAHMGSEVPVGEWTAYVRVPRKARMTLLRDGRPIAASTGSTLEHRIAQPGVYRAEARLHWRGAERLWIVSNPIYVRDRIM